MHRMIRTLAQFSALLGGFVLIAIVLMTTLSIIGRSLNKMLHSDWAKENIAGLAQSLLDMGVGEISGNYELLEAGIAFSIFAFLPICQLFGAHATVDIFTSALPVRVNRWIAAFWEIVLTLIILLLVRQLFAGLERYYGNGETTLFLQFPRWWAYAMSFSAGIVASIVAVYCAVMRVAEAAQNRVMLPTEFGEH